MEQLETHRNQAAQRREHAERIIANLPSGPYSQHYIPAFPDHDKHVAAVQELLSTRPVTTPEHIDDLSARFEDIALRGTAAVIIDHNCAEPVALELDITEVARSISHNLEDSTAALHSGRRDSPDRDIELIRIKRGRGQNTKPRTDEVETVTITLPDGSTKEVTRPTYKGDAIHSEDNREHRSARMVGAADQAHALEIELKRLNGCHIPAAHEALLLQYEAAFTRLDPVSMQHYLLSADLPWIGLRTNDPDGPHVQALRGIANPIGIKLGPDTTAEQLRQLVRVLNPARRAGKLVLMPRFGVANLDRLDDFAQTVAEESEEALVVADIMHGNTRKLKDGVKTRLVGDLITESEAVSTAFRAVGLRMHGVHLETIADDSRKECIDEIDETPRHVSLVDPQLNRTQTRRVLRAITPHLL